VRCVRHTTRSPNLQEGALDVPAVQGGAQQQALAAGMYAAVRLQVEVNITRCPCLCCKTRPQPGVRRAIPKENLGLQWHEQDVRHMTLAIRTLPPIHCVLRDIREDISNPAHHTPTLPSKSPAQDV
jgi:hypothetical protein